MWTSGARTLLNVMVGLQLRGDPRVQAYLECIGGTYDFNAAYRDALELARKRRDKDIGWALKGKRNIPIASFPIEFRGGIYGVYLSPSELKHARSLIAERGRVKLYVDDTGKREASPACTGKREVLQEWKEQGLTIYFNGCYKYLTGEHEKQESREAQQA